MPQYNLEIIYRQGQGWETSGLLDKQVWPSLAFDANDYIYITSKLYFIENILN